MAIFESKAEEKKDSYVALLDKAGDLVAFVTPVKGVSQELLAETLRSKKLNVEIRESRADRTTLKL